MFLVRPLDPPQRCERCHSSASYKYFATTTRQAVCRRCACVVIYTRTTPANLASVDAFDPAYDYESSLAHVQSILSTPTKPLKQRLRSASEAVTPYIRLRRLSGNRVEATCPVFRRIVGPFPDGDTRPRKPTLGVNPDPLPDNHPSPFAAVVTATRNAIAAGMSAKDSRVYVYRLRGVHLVICTLAGPTRVRITSTNGQIAFLDTQS
jgi:hypothetical protein